MSEQDKLLDLARRYIEFFNNPNGTAEELVEFLSPNIVWREMPNKFAPNGRTNDYAKMLKNFQIGLNLVRPQNYRIDNIIAQGDTVALELSWEGTTVQAIGPFPAGARLTSQVASFLQFQDDKLIKQTDYPCYPPTEE
jgi:predicted ester cyclase